MILSESSGQPISLIVFSRPNRKAVAIQIRSPVEKGNYFSFSQFPLILNFCSIAKPHMNGLKYN